MLTYLWLFIAGVLLALELMSGTIYLLMLALACLPAWGVQLIGGGFLAQCVAYLCSSTVLVVAVRFKRKPQCSVRPAQSKPSADDLDAGMVVNVTQWQHGVGHAHYRGAHWEVEHILPAPLLQPGRFEIVRLNGTRLLVKTIDAL